MHVNDIAVNVVLDGISRDPILAIDAAHDMVRRGVLYPPRFAFDQGAFCRRLVNRCPEMQPLLFHLRFIGVVYDVMVIGHPFDIFIARAIWKHNEQMQAVLEELYGAEAKLLLVMMGERVS